MTNEEFERLRAFDGLTIRELQNTLSNAQSDNETFREALEAIIQSEEEQSIRSFGLGDIAREALKTVTPN